MTAPIVTPETTLRELGEILRRSSVAISHASVGEGVAYVSAGNVHGSSHDACRHDLAAAIDAALTKAGAR